MRTSAPAPTPMAVFVPKLEHGQNPISSRDSPLAQDRGQDRCVYNMRTSAPAPTPMAVFVPKPEK